MKCVSVPYLKNGAEKILRTELNSLGTDKNVVLDARITNLYGICEKSGVHIQSSLVGGINTDNVTLTFGQVA